MKEKRDFAVFYDRAGLPEGKKFKDILQAYKDTGVIEFCSAACGNMSQKNLDPKNCVKVLSAEYQVFLKKAKIRPTVSLINGKYEFVFSGE